MSWSLILLLMEIFTELLSEVCICLHFPRLKISLRLLFLTVPPTGRIVQFIPTTLSLYCADIQLEAGEPAYYFVVYFDYGNTEWTSLNNLAPLLSQFSYLPPQCVKCTMGELSPTQVKIEFDMIIVIDSFFIIDYCYCCCYY